MVKDIAFFVKLKSKPNAPMKNFLFAVLFISLVSCQKEVDRTDIYEYGKIVVKDIIQDSIKSKTHFHNDLPVEAVEQLGYIVNAFKDKKDYEFLKFDTVKAGIFAMDSNLYRFKAYFKFKDGDISSLSFCYVRDSLNQIKPFLSKGDYQLRGYNISEACREPYLPSKLMFPTMSWQYELYNRNTFETAKLNIHNKTKYDIDYIKYRLSLIRKLDGQIFFSKTLEYNQKLYSKDMIMEEITPLIGVNAGVNLESGDTFEYLVEVLEVKPNNSYACLELQEVNNSVASQKK